MKVVGKSVYEKSFIIGSGIRCLDFNDTYLSKEPAHPSDNIAPLLALHLEGHGSQEDLIYAIALAYQIQCWLCDVTSLRKEGWDHVSYLPISVACGTSKLLRLDIESTRNAIALAAVSAASLRKTRVGTLSEWKGLSASNSAMNGLFAVILAKAGITGPYEVFEGGHGFFHQFSDKHFATNEAGFALSLLKARACPDEILRTYIKFRPIEYHIQAVADAIVDLESQVFDIDKIQSIEIQTYEAAVSIVGGDKAKWHPKTRETADHSIPYISAIILHHGDITLDHFSAEVIQNTLWARLMDKVTIKENAEFTKCYGESFPVEICIKIQGGQDLVKRVDYPRGHYKNPMTDKEIEEKFWSLSKTTINSYSYEDRVGMRSICVDNCFDLMFRYLLSKS